MPRSDTNVPRLLVVPGLNDSGPAHWQTWLQLRHPGALRVQQPDWATAHLVNWSNEVTRTLHRAGDRSFIALAHSFGCLALVHHLLSLPDSPIVAALLVAPADPARFGIASALHRRPLPIGSTVVASRTDPWMGIADAAGWAARWGSRFVDVGDAGHINVDSGHGPWPFASHWVRRMQQRELGRGRPDRAALLEWSFAV